MVPEHASLLSGDWEVWGVQSPDSSTEQCAAAPRWHLCLSGFLCLQSKEPSFLHCLVQTITTSPSLRMTQDTDDLANSSGAEELGTCLCLPTARPPSSPSSPSCMDVCSCFCYSLRFIYFYIFSFLPPPSVCVRGCAWRPGKGVGPLQAEVWGSF